MNCSNMLHFIWVVTVLKSTRLRVFQIQKVKDVCTTDQNKQGFFSVKGSFPSTLLSLDLGIGEKHKFSLGKFSLKKGASRYLMSGSM